MTWRLPFDESNEEVIPVATQFEFRLIDGTAPDGELSADDLIAIAQSLKEVGMKLGRAATDAENVGRPLTRTRHIASLTIGLAAGSTRILVRRADSGIAALDFDLDEEASFDARFEALIESIGVDERPDWVSGPLALAAGKLRSALANAAPKVEFAVGGDVRLSFNTSETHRKTWLPVEAEPNETTVTFVGRLRMVNLDKHRLQVTDDLGNRVALIDVEINTDLGRLLNEYVSVVGSPGFDSSGRLSQIQAPVIAQAGEIPGTPGARAPVQLAEIRAPGPAAGGLRGLTDEETESYLLAMGM